MTLDAVHRYDTPAKILTFGGRGRRRGRWADSGMTAIQENPPTLLAHLQTRDWDTATAVHDTFGKGHGRREGRSGTLCGEWTGGVDPAAGRRRGGAYESGERCARRGHSSW